MTRPFIFIFLIVLLGIMSACQEQKEITPGVSRDLARERSKSITELQYQLEFDIPENRSDPIPARMVMTCSIASDVGDIVLDFNEQTEKLLRIEANGAEVEIRHLHEHVIIPKQYLNAGENRHSD